MVTTVTLNPAIDNIVQVDDFRPNALNRAKKEHLFPGGKGVNVSLALTRMGVENRAVGFLAGATGVAYRELLRDSGVQDEFVMLETGFTRINTKITSAEETEINGNGPDLCQRDLDVLCKKLGDLKPSDYLVFSGSVPGSITGAYAYLMQTLQAKKVHLVADTTGNEMMQLLPFGPFLVKPNLHELEELLQMPITTKAQLVAGAKTLQQKGARNVLVSMGGDGAFLLTEQGAQWMADGISGAAANTVGAGDSMVAGFLYGWLSHRDYAHALRFGVAAGTATAFSFGIAEFTAIQRYAGQGIIRKLEA